MKIFIALVSVIGLGLAGFFLLGSGAENVEVVPQEEVVGTQDTLEESSVPDSVEGGTPQEFTIDSFSFGYSAAELYVSEGDIVTINLTNSDGFHDWVIDEFDAATEKITVGETTSVTFVADKAGTYEYYCSVGSHRAEGMVGTLIVE